jgi:hypothetical protein
LIEHHNHVANKAAAAVVSLTEPFDAARTLIAFEYTPKMKRTSIQAEHILDDAFRKTAEKGPHEITKPYYEHVTVEGLL